MMSGDGDVRADGEFPLVNALGEDPGEFASTQAKGSLADEAQGLGGLGRGAHG